MSFLDKSQKPEFVQLALYRHAARRALEEENEKSGSPVQLPTQPGTIVKVRCNLSGVVRYVLKNHIDYGKLTHVGCCGTDKRRKDGRAAPTATRLALRTKSTFHVHETTGNAHLNSASSLLTCLGSPAVPAHGTEVRLDVQTSRASQSYTIPHAALVWLAWAARVTKDPTTHHATPRNRLSLTHSDEIERHWRSLKGALHKIVADAALEFSPPPEWALPSVAHTYGVDLGQQAPTVHEMPTMPTARTQVERLAPPLFLASDLDSDTYTRTVNGEDIIYPAQVRPILSAQPFTEEQTLILVMCYAAHLSAQGFNHAQYPYLHPIMLLRPGHDPKIMRPADAWAVSNPPVRPGNWFTDFHGENSDRPGSTHIGPDGVAIPNMVPEFFKRVRLMFRPPLKVWVPLFDDVPVKDDEQRRAQWRQAQEEFRNGRVGYREVTTTWPAHIMNLPMATGGLLQEPSNFIQGSI